MHPDLQFRGAFLVLIVSVCLVVGATVVAAPAGPAMAVVSSVAMSARVIGSSSGVLTGVTCPSANDCWAVGDSAAGTLADHWDGTHWKVMAGPKSNSPGDMLDGVSCPATNDCWAVGNSAAGTLVEHWDGSDWSVVASPNESGATADYLRAVSCPSATDCFAVGNYNSAVSPASAFETLVEHWDGTTWSIVASPNPNGSGSLTGVSCPSTTTCTAVGYSGSESFVEQWDGTAWSIALDLAMPFDTPWGIGLLSVACPSTTSCYAVGTFPYMTLYHTYLWVDWGEYWDGSTWTEFGVPVGGNYLSFESDANGVSCATPTDCFAVGGWSGGNTSQTLVGHGHGNAWSIVPSPNPVGTYSGANDVESGLNGVSCVNATDCWAVGSYNTGAADMTLAEHWDGKAWLISDPIANHASFACDIRSHANHKYVSTETGDTGLLRGVLQAHATTINGWADYQCVAVGTNRWAIKSRANGKYVSTETGDAGLLRGVLQARATNITPWEQYTFSSVAACGCYALKAVNSKYVTAELDYPGTTNGLLRARSTAIGAGEQFNITPN